MSKPQMTGAVKAGAKHVRSLLKKYDIELTEDGLKYAGKSPEYQALTEDQQAEVARFMEWWWGMFNFAAGPEEGAES